MSCVADAMAMSNAPMMKLVRMGVSGSFEDEAHRQ